MDKKGIIYIPKLRTHDQDIIMHDVQAHMNLRLPVY